MEELIERRTDFLWEICARNQGDNVIKYCDDLNEVLDVCGRLFYANTIFFMDLLQNQPRRLPN